MLAGGLFASFYSVLTLFGSFNVELSHFDNSLYVWLGLKLHINPCRLFNAKSIFIDTNDSISNNSV